MAIDFLSGINQNIYGQLMNEIHNVFKMGWDEYTRDLTSAYNM